MSYDYKLNIQYLRFPYSDTTFSPLFYTILNAFYHFSYCVFSYQVVESVHRLRFSAWQAFERKGEGKVTPLFKEGKHVTVMKKLINLWPSEGKRELLSKLSYLPELAHRLGERLQGRHCFHAP